MRILAIADEVDQRLYGPILKQRFSDVSLVLSCGDLPIYYLEFIVSVLNVPLLYVRGNHAQAQMSASGEVKTEPEGCVNIDGRVVKERGLLIAGLEGSMRYSDGPHQYTEAEMRLKALQLAPRLLLNRWRHGRYLDILVTHAAPFGIQDAADLCHRGFKAFVWLMDRFRPRYLIHGHIHAYTPGVVTESLYRETQVLNAFRYRLIEIPDESLLD
ncbi:MAG: metallophosphoesterase [Anaerolineae bacterium]|nr:metallophosphoesterase [Anaerolineae bacterium]